MQGTLRHTVHYNKVNCTLQQSELYITTTMCTTQTINGRWGREKRQVELPLSSDSIGLELCGVSSTGQNYVFVPPVHV